MTPGNEESHPVEQSVKTHESLNEERREALRRIGRLGAYTAPTVLAMLASGKAPAATDA
jgi:hypothetical protein